MIQGMGGLMSITGERDDRPGGGPQKVGVAVADLMSGMYATVAVLAALASRERTGAGQHIDLALLDVQAAMLANQAMNYLVSGRPPARYGNAHPNIVPYQAFATSDGHVIVAVGNDTQFRRFCDIAGCAALADDPRYGRNRDRVEHRDELIARLEPIFKSRPSADWLEALERAAIPCGPINDLEQVFADPHLLHRNMVWRAAHGSGGDVAMVASPLRLSATPVSCPGPPPALGEHTDDVLGGLLGLDHESIQALREAGVVG
jgi:formyl-CoA transferase